MLGIPVLVEHIVEETGAMLIRVRFEDGELRVVTPGFGSCAARAGKWIPVVQLTFVRLPVVKAYPVFSC